ncbi:chorismate mutase/prephenate dehydratase [Candidatus Tremblaya phenacola PAVE]|nr:chorismate mutase/prephenate dehydratase [Candidatus Tremblaya phenacola PAVE]
MKLLGCLRQEVSLLDCAILLAFVGRLRVVLRVGEVKRALALPTNNPKREVDVVSNLHQQFNATNLNLQVKKVLQGIWSQIIRTSKKVEEDCVVTTLGPKGSLTDFVFSFGNNKMKSFFFWALEEAPFLLGKSDIVLIPFQNSSSGLVNPCNIMTEKLVGSDCGGREVRIKHHLPLSFGTSTKKLGWKFGTQKYALQQCALWLVNAGHTRIGFNSTAEAQRWSNWVDGLSAVNAKDPKKAEVCSYVSNRTVFLAVTANSKDWNIQHQNNSRIVRTPNSQNRAFLIWSFVLLIRKKRFRLNCSSLSDKLDGIFWVGSWGPNLKWGCSIKT